MDFTKIQKFLKILFLLPAIFFLMCASPKHQSDEIILAKIANKEILGNEFLQCSELTIRLNNFKNISLNNLISEKILTLEAEYNKFSLNASFQSPLKVIKQQLMRDQLYSEVAFYNIQLDSIRIRNTYILSVHEHEFKFYTINKKELVHATKPLSPVMYNS